MSGIDWDRVFADTPRRPYIPNVVWAGGRQFDRSTDPDGWAEAVAADIPLVTQVDDGAEAGQQSASSSASMPLLVRLMLEQLDIEPHHRVLEIGTGTGWNAALLATALVDGRVTSIEVDPAVAAQARVALFACDFEPTLIVGDGLQGHKEGALYDRLIATMAVQRVPYEWVEQVRPGGVIVTPWGTSFNNSGLLRLVVEDDGTASGRFAGSVNFMWARSQRPRFNGGHFVDHVVPDGHADSAATRKRRTTMDVREVHDEHASFAVGLTMPDVEQQTYLGSGEHGGEWTTWYTDGLSWASVDYVPGADSFEVNEGGPRDLWANVERSYGEWHARGKPTREEHGVTVTPDGQRTWVNGPTGRVEIGPAPVA